MNMRRLDYWGGDSYPEYAGEMKGADTANQQRQQELAMQQEAYNTQKQQLAQLKQSVF